MSASPSLDLIQTPRYAEKVYAGVLGKIIGVYLGRPFEGWDHEHIERDLGEIDYYVDERLNQPLIVTDDDISGTFTFLRALEDYGYDPDLTSKKIGRTWMNYIIEGRTILWWGGLGMSTEHTAFLRMKHGILAPRSGSIEQNGQVVAEQIGSQIFIDGWGLINPGDPERAADFAARAAKVSHDGEAVFGAQVVAAMVAAAFVEDDIDRLLDLGSDVIPRKSLTFRLINDVRSWHAEGMDWREGFQQIKGNYGYDKYGGNCHIVPNHALIIHALLHGRGDFGKSLMIVNTCGWDTDCNSGNVGCILGVMGGLEGISAGRDFRGPVADRLYLPTADGGRSVTDAVRETYEIVRAAYGIHGLAPDLPKDGARFHFSLPGSVQGFVRGKNVDGRLALRGDGAFMTPTFTPPAARGMRGYGVVASPTLTSGQEVKASWEAEPGVEVRLALSVYNEKDELTTFLAEPGQKRWIVPDTGGYPIAEVGVHVSGGSATLDWLTWSGAPTTTLQRVPGTAWRDAWVNGVSEWLGWGEPFRIVQNEGTGLLMTGAREWTDYRVTATIRPHLAERAGIAARVQGMGRYYALLLCRDGFARLVESLDGEYVHAEAALDWTFGQDIELTLEVEGDSIRGLVDGELVLSATDGCLKGGGVAYVLQEGRMASDSMRVEPL